MEQPKTKSDRPAAASGLQQTHADMDNGLVTAVLTGVVIGVIEPELIPGMAIGVAATLGPRLLPALTSTLRPVMQTVVRAGYSATRSAREMIAEAGEQFEDLLAEARAQETEEQPGGANAAPANSGRRRGSTPSDQGATQ
jgi:hypothetical protein